MFKNDFSEKAIIKFQLLNMFSHLFIYFFVKPKTNKQKTAKLIYAYMKTYTQTFSKLNFFRNIY